MNIQFLSYNYRLVYVLFSALLITSCATYKAPAKVSVPVSKEIRNQLPHGVVVVTKSEKTREGEKYTRIKFINKEGFARTMTFDKNYKQIQESMIPRYKREPIGPLLKQKLVLPPQHAEYVPDEGIIEVVVVLREEVEDVAPVMSGQGQFEQGQAKELFLEGKPGTDENVEAANEKYLSALAKQHSKRVEKRRNVLKMISTREKLQESPNVLDAVKRGLTEFRMKIKKADIEKFIENNKDLVTTIELYRPSEDSISGALTDMGVDTWAQNNCHMGGGIGIYMSESGGRCPTSPHISNDWYTNISGGAASDHANHVGNILRMTAPKAHIYCGSADSTASNPTSYSPRIFLSTHSFNWYQNNTAYRSQDRNFDNSVYNDRLGVFISAGNKKSSLTTYTVLTPAKAFNALTLGNYNDSSHSMNSGSLYVDPDPHNEKPEIVAPGTSISTSVGSCTGTSCSAPFAAGFAADLISQYPWLKVHPELLKALMMAGASRNIEGAARLSEKDGAGAINYLNTAYNGSFNWWSGGNSSWFDSNNKVNVTRTFQAGQHYRIALVWLVPGNYAFDHENVSMDLDLKVYRPDGSFVTGSYSYDNGFEIVDFTAPVSGNYTVTIHRYWNSGSGSVIMAIHSQRIL